MKRCAVCGHENDDWRPLCVGCGASFAGPAAEPVLAPPPPFAPPPPPPPPGGFTPGMPEVSGSAGGRRSPKAVVTVAIVVVVGLVAGAIGVATLASSKKSASAPTTTFPATWDPRVTDLIGFDAHQRGLDYTHPVKVEFLSSAAFKKRVTTDNTKLTAKDKLDLQHALEELRALGMVEGKVDLLAKVNQLSAASTLAYYDDKKKVIVIPGQTLDVEQRVTLAHELTHTLDDERFNLAKVQKVGDQHDTDAVTALVEGDAVWVENKYVAKLSQTDQRAYQRSQQTGVSSEDLKGIPKIFEVQQQWPYDFGPVFVDILQHVGGNSKVNAAFRSPPIDEEQVLDPITYLDGDKPGAISMPKLPHGAKKLDSSKEFGSLGWYLILSERIDPHVAMKATLGWGADSYIDATEGTKTCISIHYRGETRRDNAEMMTALHQWIAALPAGMATVKTNGDDTISLHSCDPGAAAKVVTDRSVDAYQLLLFRTAIIDEFMKGGLTPALATCAADAVTAQTSVSDVTSGRGPAILTNGAALRQIGVTCAIQIRTVVPQDEIDK